MTLLDSKKKDRPSAKSHYPALPEGPSRAGAGFSGIGLIASGSACLLAPMPQALAEKLHVLKLLKSEQSGARMEWSALPHRMSPRCIGPPPSRPLPPVAGSYGRAVANADPICWPRPATTRPSAGRSHFGAPGRTVDPRSPGSPPPGWRYRFGWCPTSPREFPRSATSP